MPAVSVENLLVLPRLEAPEHEEGGMKRTDRRQLEFKRQADPKGILNPGRLYAGL